MTNVVKASFSLVVNNPDNPFDTPLFDAYADTWDELVRSATNALEPGDYDAIRTFYVGLVENEQHGTFQINWDDTVLWVEKYELGLLA